jgi:hypothetical protein
MPPVTVVQQLTGLAHISPGLLPRRIPARHPPRAFAPPTAARCDGLGEACSRLAPPTAPPLRCQVLLGGMPGIGAAADPQAASTEGREAPPPTLRAHTGPPGAPQAPPRPSPQRGGPRPRRGAARPLHTPGQVCAGRGPGLPTRPACRLLCLALGGRLAGRVGRKPTAAARKAGTEDRHGPGQDGRRTNGGPQGNAWAQQAAAFFQISRAIRTRVCSARRRGSAAWSGVRPPGPGNAPWPWAVQARCQRRCEGGLKNRKNTLTVPLRACVRLGTHLRLLIGSPRPPGTGASEGS